MGAETTELTSALETRNLTAGYGDRVAIEGINLQIPRNQVTAIIGPSGCGKSTFLRCLDRMHEETRGKMKGKVNGQVLLDGEDIYAPGISRVWVRRKVGMIFQEPVVIPWMSLQDDVTSGLRIGLGVRDKNKLAEATEEALRSANLWDEVKDRLNDKATDFSGGQQQRLCIARALTMNPDVLLMDEPCSKLDPNATTEIEELIIALKERKTIVVVTHNMQQGARVADQAVFMCQAKGSENEDFQIDVHQPGRVIEVGSKNQIFVNPVNELTNRYVTGHFG